MPRRSNCARPERARVETDLPTVRCLSVTPLPGASWARRAASGSLGAASARVPVAGTTPPATMHKITFSQAMIMLVADHDGATFLPPATGRARRRPTFSGDRDLHGILSDLWRLSLI
ncbi:hypothetical protein GCM10009733_041900 [Nonomuraea maheshkhaliensis]|uniref:Uncharacterized protein n=1 Tax=Nonomuraea maheshkhaliensis TaxID=419590 RepID=A0ABN2FCB4_9ACTN